MHIPDGYLSPATCVVLGGAMLPVWYKASAKVKKSMDISRVPFMAMGAVFAFLMMMFNVPIPDGTSAHAVGAVFLAIALGPWAAVIAVSIALFIQAVIFGDGGILAYGANAFNMAFIMPFTGYYTYRLLAGGSQAKPRRQVFAAAVAGYVGINLAAFFVAVEFGLQPMLFSTPEGVPLYCPYGLRVAIPAMMFTHLLFAGVIEGVITGLALKYTKKISPELLYQNSIVDNGRN